MIHLTKPEGYKFDSVEIGRVTKTDGKELVVAQIDAKKAIEVVKRIVVHYEMSSKDATILLDIAANCDGMVHVFAPSQVVPIYG